MCDYSLSAVKSRPAVVGDKLTVHNFGTGTSGFADANAPQPDTAICLLPGTEISFDEPVYFSQGYGFIQKLKDAVTGEKSEEPKGHTVAIFRQINKDIPRMHHDQLEFPDGSCVMLTGMPSGARATVLQLPAAPKTKEEAEAQTRAEFVG